MKACVFFLLISLSVQNVWAWGKRGHQITGEVAALLASSEGKKYSAKFLKARSYDFGFYNNVPDIVWKRPKTYKVESTNHYMDMENYLEAFKKVKITDKEAFAFSRKEFAQKFPGLKVKEGQAFWRILELAKKLKEHTKALKASSENFKKTKFKSPKDQGKKAKNKWSQRVKKHKALQRKWLVTAGVLGHYVADLAQPLHTSKNYDGQLTGQKGIHSIYETTYVNELYPELMSQVLRQAQKDWKSFKSKNKNKSLLDLLLMHTQKSHADLKGLLKTDKKMKRSQVAIAAKAHEKMIKKNLVQGSLVLAEIFRRHLGWYFYDKKFYFFGTEPDYIYPEN